MPSEHDNSLAKSEKRSTSQPSLLPKKFLQSFLEKMVIAARLLAHETYRMKLRWFDLRSADYRIGEKAYENKVSIGDHTQTIDRVNEIQNQIETLSQPISSDPSFNQKFKGVVKQAIRAMKIQNLKFKRNRLFRKLGNELRQSPDMDSSLAAEVGHSKNVAEKINVVDSNIQTLTSGTYFWARKPLITGSLILILLLIFAGVAYEQAGALDLSSPKKAVQASHDTLAHNDIPASKVDSAQTEQEKAFRQEVKRDMLTYARLKVIYNFPKDISEVGSLSADKAGNLYGIIRNTDSDRIAFKLTPAGEFTTISHLKHGEVPQRAEPDPKTGVVAGQSGTLYGTSEITAIYQITQAGEFSVVHLFSGNEGQGIPSSPVVARDGNLYGITRNGGTASGGTIFKIAPHGSLTSLYSFMQNSDDGYYPEGGLIEASDGNFYGTTSLGGTHGGSMRMTPQGPRSGSTEGLGTINGGTIFRMSADGSLTTLHKFNERPWRDMWTNEDQLEGNHPNGPLLEGSDGNFYGTTTEGGKNGQGTIFRVTPKGELTVLYNFKGEGPMVGGLVKGSDGSMYGITSGINRTPNRGTLFKVDSRGNAIVLLTFKDRTGAGDPSRWFPFADPEIPVGGLHFGKDGKLYGLTTRGGQYGRGTFFQFDLSDSFTVSEDDKRKAEDIAANTSPPARRRSGEEIVTEFVGGVVKAAADLDAAHHADSRKLVAASGGKKILCPKCGGGKKMVVHGYDSTSWNPYKWGTLAYSLFENNRNTVTVVDCDKCGGTGVIDK